MILARFGSISVLCIRLIMTCVLPVTALSQGVSKSLDKRNFVRETQALYYSPESNGLNSFSCTVVLDWQTVPDPLKPQAYAAKQKLGTTAMQLIVPARSGPSFELQPGRQATDLTTDPFLNWFKSVLKGFASTWGTLGLNGPLPFAEHIENVEESHGFLVRLETSVAPESTELLFDEGRVLTKVSTRVGGNDLEEQTGFTQSKSGLLFTSSDTISKQQSETNHIIYSLDYQHVGKFEIPHRIRLRVNENIDIKFALEECTTNSGPVLHVAAPPLSVAPTPP